MPGDLRKPPITVHASEDRKPAMDSLEINWSEVTRQSMLDIGEHT